MVQCIYRSIQRFFLVQCIYRYSYSDYFRESIYLSIQRLFSVQCIYRSIQRLFSVQCIYRSIRRLFSVQCISCSIKRLLLGQCIYHSIQRFFSIQCIYRSIQRLFSVQCIYHSIQLFYCFIKQSRADKTNDGSIFCSNTNIVKTPLTGSFINEYWWDMLFKPKTSHWVTFSVCTAYRHAAKLAVEPTKKELGLKKNVEFHPSQQTALRGGEKNPSLFYMYCSLYDTVLTHLIKKTCFKGSVSRDSPPSYFHKSYTTWKIFYLVLIPLRYS